jgi:hypothetical protein
MAKLLPTAALAALLLCGCAAPPSQPGSAAVAAASPAAAPPASAPPHYRCDGGLEFTVRFGDDTAVLDAGAQGKETLLRDAGGATPQQTVYSNDRVRAEFGLGTTTREAVVHYASPAREVHCVED